MYKKSFSLLRAMGDMPATQSGVLQWTLQSGDIVALQQFRDNLMVATKRPTRKSTMYTVCEPWSPSGDYMSCVLVGIRIGTSYATVAAWASVGCMGVSIYVSPSCTLTHAHPISLNATWQLKFGSPLAELLGHHNTTHHQHLFVGPFKCSTICSYMGLLCTIRDSLDATSVPFKIPHPRGAHLRHRSCASIFGKDSVGRSYVCAVDYDYFFTFATVPVRYVF